MANTKKSLFLAIDIPTSIATQIEDVVRKIAPKAENDPHFEWRFGRFHITIVYFGPTDPEAQGLLEEKLELLGNCTSFPLRATSFSNSIDTSTSTTRSLRVSFEHSALVSLKERARRALEITVPLDPVRDSAGHITLAYSKGNTNSALWSEDWPKQWLSQLNTHLSDIQEWDVSELILFESTKTGYVPVKKIPLLSTKQN